MSNTKFMSKSCGKSCRLALIGIEGIATNLLVVSLIGIALAYLALIINHNLSTFQQNYIYFFLLIASVLVTLSLPGFFTVLFLSKLLGEPKNSEAYILPATGAVIYLSLSVITLLRMGNGWSVWLIIAGLIGNVIGQCLAVAQVKRRNFAAEAAYLNASRN